MKFKLSYILKYYKSILLIIFVLIISIIPSRFLPNIVRVGIKAYYDKILHFVMYFILSTAIIIELFKNTNLSKKKVYILSFISILFLSVCFELIQEIFVKNRGIDIFDILANCAGIIFSIILINSRLGEKYIKKKFIK